MDREKLLSIVTEEVVKALAKNQGRDGNALTRAAILDYSQGGGSRTNRIESSQGESSALNKPVGPIGISNRHIHISPQQMTELFGPGAELTVRNDLRQTGEFAAKETLTIITHRGRSIQNVRILGPMRDATQVELSRTDCYYLGINAPVRPSGDIDGTPGIILVGPKGSTVLPKGVIVADRHMHVPDLWAERWGLKDQQLVQCRAGADGPKPTIFDNVRIRVSPKFIVEAHLDTDDANAAGVRNGDPIEVVL